MATVIPELKSLHSPDLPERQEPGDPADVAMLVEASIGPQGQDRAEVFSFVAITPRALARDEGTRWGRGYLILNHVSWASVEAAVRNLLLRCSGDNWAQVAERLNREMHWEFEAYRK
jgi:hypothetical protein